jgi:hypothetical protein
MIVLDTHSDWRFERNVGLAAALSPKPTNLDK